MLMAQSLISRKKMFGVMSEVGHVNSERVWLNVNDALHWMMYNVRTVLYISILMYLF